MVLKLKSSIKPFCNVRLPYWAICGVRVPNLLRYASPSSNTRARSSRSDFIFDLNRAASAVYVVRRFPVPRKLAVAWRYSGVSHMVGILHSCCMRMRHPLKCERSLGLGVPCKVPRAHVGCYKVGARGIQVCMRAHGTHQHQSNTRCSAVWTP